MARWANLFPNVIYNSPLTGGSWVTGDMSLSALQDPTIGHVARTTSKNPSDTQFTQSFDTPELVGAIVTINHNLSLFGTVRATGYIKDANGNLTQAFQIESEAYPATINSYDLVFEAPNWFTGKPTKRDIGATNNQIIMILDRVYLIDSYKIEFIDPQNENDYLDIGKVMLGNLFLPSRANDNGTTFTLVDESKFVQTLGGNRYADKRKIRRRVGFRFGLLVEKEEFSRYYDFASQAGMTEEIFFIPDLDDSINLQRKSFVGTLREPTQIEQLMAKYMNVSFIAEEML